MRTSQRLEGAVMHAAVRPYATAGVALVGASVIAVAPVTAPLPDIHIAAPHVSMPVELTQTVSPITAYLELFQNTFANLTNLAGQVVADPAPILQQIIRNQIGYVTTLATAGQTTVQSLVTYVTTELPMSLQSAFALIRSGDLQDGLYDIFLAVVVFPALTVVGGLVPALEHVVETPIENLLAAVQTTFAGVFSLGIGLIAPFASLAYETGGIAQDLFNAVQAGDPLAFVDTVLAAPALLTNAVLNGASPPSFLPGLLTAGPPGFGTIQALLNLREAIAAAITPPVMMLSTLAKNTAPTAPSALPNLAANTVTVTTASQAAPAATTAITPPTVTSGPVKVRTPLNTTPTTATANGNKVASGMAGGNGTTAGGGRANAATAAGNQVSSTLSKIGAGLKIGANHAGNAGKSGSK